MPCLAQTEVAAMSIVHRVHELVHHRFLWLLVGAYGLAAAWPGAGDALRRVSLGSADAGLTLALPMLLLSVLLFNAGLGADATEVLSILRRPRSLVAGVVANAVVPVALLGLLAVALRVWPDPDEAQSLLVGLAVVAAMPVAGSSTAWAQNANGSAALSLGLVILSTVVSPFTTPLTLAAVEPLTTGTYSQALGELGGHGTGMFLLACVVIPSLAGLTGRYVLGPGIRRLRPALKLINAGVLLVLCYANASAVLPRIVAEPDWDFLVLCGAAVIGLCLAGFAAGWVLAKAVGASESQTRSLVFGLGMNNNGTGLVLASTALAGMPGAVLPVLAYNLVQHLVAGGVNRRMAR
jgi:BASS family bile acid:Na+ symporter